jgi:broad specificity phosphatase PhoE
MYLIRHGQRSDRGTAQEREKTTNPADPFLTDIGVVQSFYVGESLYREIKDIKTKQLLFICSPYQRCLKTAESILNGMQKFNINLYADTIFVEDAVREFQEPVFKEGDYESLQFFKSKDLIFFETKYNNLSFFKDIRHETSVFPETEEAMTERFEKVFEVLRNFLLEEKNKNIIPIFVTHGIFITEIYRKFLDKHVVEYIYCSTSSFDIDQSTGNWMVNYIDKRLY